jgi:YVTN family beta-propeller protein
MAISPEGDALYVVNYQSGTMTVVSTATMKVTQRIFTPPHPIGVTFEPTLNQVWVACYSGLIKIYART